MKASVHVFLKPGVLDVQGKAVQASLHGLGWEGVDDVRIGRLIAFDIAADNPAEARSRIEAMCARLLANPVIESYRIEIVG